MKKRDFVLSIMALLFAGSAVARQLEPEAALEAALKKLSATTAQMKRCKAARTPKAEMRLSHTQRAGEKSLFYVYDLPGGGYVIAAGDDRAHSLLGYTDKGSFDEARKNPAFESWVAQCSEAMTWISSQPEGTSTQLSTGTSTQLSTGASTRRSLRLASEALTPVEPLLGEIEWNQEAPYSLMCPYRLDESNISVQAPTGCVATATAQVMAYWQWPLSGEGTNTNERGGEGDPNLTVDFSQSTYDWENMLPQYTGGESVAQQLAVAKLMADVGCAVNMKYTADVSLSSTDMILPALAHHFKYNKAMKLVMRTHYTSEQWNEMLRQDLREGRPIIFGANSGGNYGHEFVIDGYNAEGLYHVNWGWSGESNGHFDMNFLNPENQGVGGGGTTYNVAQRCALGVEPDKDGTSKADPFLTLTSNLKGEDDVFTLTVNNQSVEDFTGQICFEMTDSVGNRVWYEALDMQESPIESMQADTLTFALPEDLELEEGYVMRTYYKAEVDGDELEFNYVLSAPPYIMYHIDEDGEPIWTYQEEDAPMLKVKEFKCIQHYANYNPTFELTVTNSAESTVEYNNIIRIYVGVPDGDLIDPYIVGTSQLFLQPGETKTVRLSCERSLIDGALTAGEYAFWLCMDEGGREKDLGDGTVDLVDPNILMSNIVFDTDTLREGDELGVSFEVTNQSAYDAMHSYAVVFYPEGEVYSNLKMKSPSFVLPAGKPTAISFKGLPSLKAGRYIAKVRDLTLNLWCTREGTDLVVVSKETGMQGVQTNAAADACYDLTGRRVMPGRKAGIYVRKGKKVISF